MNWLRTILRRWLGIDEIDEDVTRWRLNVDSILERIENNADLARNAVGGAYWRTKTGHMRGIAFFSTRHLRTILDERWTNHGPTLFAIERELLRRAEDDYWEKRAKGKRARMPDSVRQAWDEPIKPQPGLTKIMNDWIGKGEREFWDSQQ